MPPSIVKPLRGLRVAAVVDEFTRDCLAPEVTLVNLHARLWRAQLAAFRPDLVFVESAWRGARDSWHKRLASYPSRRDGTLERLIRYCRRRDIPTVFWNKEDPVHFDRFIDKAKLFDYVLTTDEAKVDDYRRHAQLGPDRVAPMMFAAQPLLHNPIAARHADRVCFAGSYGDAEFPERRRALEVLLDAATGYALTIYDRNSHLATGPNVFPARYRPYLRDRVAYKDLLAEYRNCKVFLNVNSIADSQTMFARRIFELLACGTSVVSSPSAGMERLFGDLVAVATTKADARAAIDRFMTDDAHRAHTSATGITRVMLEHTYEDRLREVCRLIGKSCPDSPIRDFAVFAFVRGPEELERLAQTLSCQSLGPKTVAVAAPRGWAAKIEGRLSAIARSLTVLDLGSFASERDAARHAARVVQTGYVSCITTQRTSRRDLFAAQVANLRFANADVIGSPSYAGQHHRYTMALAPAMLITADALARVGWSDAGDIQAQNLSYSRLTCYAGSCEPRV